MEFIEWILDKTDKAFDAVDLFFDKLAEWLCE